MNVLDYKSSRALLSLYEWGKHMGWHGFIGGSISEWVSTRDLMELQSELHWDGAYLPLGAEVPQLARECFFFVRQEGVRFDTGEDLEETSLMILQLGDTGDTYRVLWESVPDDHPPLEITLHMVVHAARRNGAGGVVYHCQPVSVIALTTLARQRGQDLTDELEKGFAAIRNMVPDGVGCIPWGMHRPIQRGMQMTPEMLTDMQRFMAEIAQHIAHHEAMMLVGEGIVAAASSEQTVYGLVNTIEHAAEIRLKILSAGGQ